MKQLILVVDDNFVSRDALRTCLQSSGFDVAVLYEPDKVMARVEVERPALILLASGPSFGGSLAALQALRGRGDDLPLIMLGEGGEVTERIVALECGADDFISKPFNVREVMVRVHVILKRAGQFSLHDAVCKPLFRFNNFELDYASRALTFRGEVVPLRQTEYAVLNLFTTAPGRLFSKETIARRVRPDSPDQLAAVGLWVHRLRKRIERDTAAPKLIQTVYTKGYVFRPGFEDQSLNASRKFKAFARLAEDVIHYNFT